LATEFPGTEFLCTLWVFLLLHICSGLSDLSFELYHSHGVIIVHDLQIIVHNILSKMIHWTQALQK